MERAPDGERPVERLRDRPGFEEWTAEVMARLKDRRDGGGHRRRPPKGRTLWRSLLDRRAP